MILTQLSGGKVKLMEVNVNEGQSMMVNEVETVPALVELQLSGHKVKLMGVKVRERQMLW